MEKTSDEQLKKEMAFDQYGRYAVIRDIINLNRRDGEKFRVLDVGGRGNLMRKFLPEDDVFYLDPLVDTKDENYIEGDGCDMPLKDGEFDWVVSGDVFEHIPQMKREDFLQENTRVAGVGTILAAPFFTEETEKAEIEANENFKIYAGGRENDWLKEHIENGLPHEAELEKYLKKNNFPFQKIYNNNLELWRHLVGIAFNISEPAFDLVRDKFFDFNYFYNSEVFPYDSFAPAYRRIYFIKKKPGLKELALKSGFPPALFEKTLEKSLDFSSQINFAYKKNLENGRLRIGELTDQARQKDDHIEHLKKELFDIRTSLRWKVPNYIYKIFNNKIRKLVSRSKVTISYKRKMIRRQIRALCRKLNIAPPRENFFVSERENRSLRNIGQNNIQYPEPAVSIIVLMFNMSQVTIECLKALATNTVGISYEIVLLDNGSKLEESRKVKNFIARDFPAKDTVNYIRLGTNRGFGEGNNIAAEYARGELLVFLNNDVEVGYNWLFPLVYTLKNAPCAGCVGAKLIYPDGKLQEAGAFLDENGVARQRGKFDDADKAEYNNLEIVDYCSAATLILPKNLFFKALGFDPCYGPAYYEDSDLCLKIRELGYLTYYCPQSPIIHHEHSTSRGMNLSNIIEINRDKFLQRWKGKIDHRNSGKLPSRQVKYDAREGQSTKQNPSKKLGLLSWYEVMPPGGGEKYLLSIAEVLKENYHAELITPFETSRVSLANIAKELSLDLGEIGVKTINQPPEKGYDVFVSLGNEIFPFVEGRGAVNMYMCQFPFPTEGENLKARQTFLKDYDRVLVNSEFSKGHYLRKTKKEKAICPPVSVLYPPVSLISGNADQKKNIILHVGRFFLKGHNKKQLEMIRAFKKLIEKYNIRDWELHLAGAIQSGQENREYFWRVKEESRGAPIVLHPNIPRKKLEQLYREASIYWHATGFGYSPDLQPEKQEHFGITTVEAMSARCVPIVIATAGQKEIVEAGISGFLWNNLDDLMEMTNRVITNHDSGEIRALRDRARAKAERYSLAAFQKNLDEILADIRKNLQ